MKISVSKLIANRSNALKSTGPRSEIGKRRSTVNSKKHGLNTLLVSHESELGEEYSLLIADAIRRGYSKQDAHVLVSALQLGRAVIDAKHSAYKDKPESEKVESLTQREWIRSVRDTQIPESQMEEADIREVGNLMFRQGQQDHDPVSQVGVKIEEHRKLMRYEQRAVNQIRKAARIKK
ncbi:hypothetical protein N9D28_02105 [Luminiphilus sp.]|nr:hypothetical protein [Luminiphilus sp.]